MNMPLPMNNKNRLGLLVATVVSALLLSLTTVATAHSLESSTISLRLEEESANATISLAIETLDSALGTSYADAPDLEPYTDEIIAYLDQHLTVTDATGHSWGETYTNPHRESVELIDTFRVDVTFDTGGSHLDYFAITYDAIVEAVPGHEVVIVLTDQALNVTTPGVITAVGDVVEVGDKASSVNMIDMIGYGFSHVLEGADHLLFLITLLLVAPLVAHNQRWQSASELLPTIRRVFHIVTAFTVGHSITLAASVLGWVSFPSRPIEVLIAFSVGISAIHAIRPLITRGEVAIAAGFGLVHGLAFAGILADLGFAGATSLLTLLAFNIGIELAQLAATGLVFPSLYLLARTRYYPTFRVVSALLALLAAIFWILDRLLIIPNPLAGVETSAVNHLIEVAMVLALMALVAYYTNQKRVRELF